MPHVRLDEKHIITTIVERNGNRLRFGLTNGSEITTEEGDHISAGRIPAFENKNMKKWQYTRAKRHQEELNKLFDRYNKLTAIGIAATYNRLHAPLREYSKG